MGKHEMTHSLKIKIFADGASLPGILEMSRNPLISGFTTNPTLMRKAGISDYEAFAREALQVVTTLPISFEVFSDEMREMERQALKIAKWGDNVYVKIPSTNTLGESTHEMAARLAQAGVKLNVTAMTTPEHVARMLPALSGGPPAIASIFAGRVADSGRDPVPLMRDCLELLQTAPNVELLWASPREVLNLIQANEIGCHIITMTNDLISKMTLLGKNLDEFAMDTVKMFRHDAEQAGFHL